MKKTLLLNSEVSYEISKIGHTQCICIADCGLPVPNGVKRIDLALKPFIPAFLDVLDAVLSEMYVERVLLAEEVKSNCFFHNDIISLLTKYNPNIVIEYVKHEVFKTHNKSSVAVIRTGEQTPYANILLYSGVTF